VQKVILINLASKDFGSEGMNNLEVQEVLNEETSQGWKVIHVAATSAGAGSGSASDYNYTIRGWFLVTLEKN
jgi:hypothetical protein